jgi:hypothetical protein
MGYSLNDLKDDIGGAAGFVLAPLTTGLGIGEDYLKKLGDDFVDWVRGDMPEIPGGTVTTTYADPSKLPLIYGTVKTGGRFIFEVNEDVGGDPVNEYLHYVVLYCDAGHHGIQGFKEHYFNEIPVSSGEFDGYYETHEFTGAPGEALPLALRTNLPQWTVEHTLDGWAGCYYKLRWKGGEGKQPFSRKPSITSEISGAKIQRFDQGVARYSEDPIEILWDYLRSDRYGWGWPLAYLESVRSVWEAESTFARQSVGGRPLMSCNVRLDLNQARKSLLDKIRADFRINLPPRLGEVVPVIEKDKPVVKVFTDDNIGEGYIVERPADLKTHLNRVTIRWNDAIDNYKSREYTYPDQAEHEILVTQDGGRKLEKTISSHCINNEAEAKQLAFVILNRSRHGARLKIPIFADDFDLEPSDLIQLTNTDLNIVNGIYHVKSIDFAKYEIEVEEHRPSDYPWQGYENQNPSGGAVIPDLSKRWASDVTAVNVVVHNQKPASPGNDLSTLAITVSPPTDLIYSHGQVRYRATSVTAWSSHWQDLKHSTSLVVPYAPNTEYEIQVRSVSKYNRYSEWIDGGTINLGASTGALPGIENLTLLNGFTFDTAGAPISWGIDTATLPLYFSHFQIQIKSLDNTILNTYESVGKSFVYSHAKNLADNAGRAFKISVRCVSRTNDLGFESEIQVENPPPEFLSGLTFRSSIDSITLTFNPVTAPDFKTIKIWVGNTSGFIPVPTAYNLETTNNQVTVSGLTVNTQYFIRYSLQDIFHGKNDIGVLSSEFTVNTAVDAQIAFNNALTRAQLAADRLALQTVIGVGNANTDRQNINSSSLNIAALKETALAHIVDIKKLQLDTTQLGSTVLDFQDTANNQAIVLQSLTSITAQSRSDISSLKTTNDGYAQSFQEISLELEGFESAITNMQTVTGGYASTFQSIDLELDGVATNITDLQIVSSDNASSLSTLSTQVGGYTTAITNLQTVTSNNATTLSTVQTQQTTAGLILTALEENGTTKATAGLFVDTDGALAGVFIGANETSSELIFKADVFKFKTNDTNISPFTITNENKLEFEGEINIDMGRVVITESVLDLNSHAYKMAINTQGLLSPNNGRVGGIDIKTDGVGIESLSTNSYSMLLRNTGSNKTALHIDGNGTTTGVKAARVSTAFNADSCDTGFFAGKNTYFARFNVSQASTFPGFWTGPGAHYGEWRIISDRDGIWVANSDTWTNILNGATKQKGQALNKTNIGFGSGYGNSPSR